METKYKDFSTYRGELMGIAMLLIMFSHNTMDFPGFVHNVNSGLKMLGQVGVDLFFFISGFGCFYSMHKNNNIVSFYRYRICFQIKKDTGIYRCMYPRDIPASREITGNYHTAHLFGDKSFINSIVLTADVCDQYPGSDSQYPPG